MRSISGFNSGSLDGSFASGQPVSASALNKLAGSADKSRPMMSNDIQFMSGMGGVASSLNQPIYTPQGGILQQFEIVAEPYVIGEDTTNFTIIRVAKGEVVWSPKLLQESILPSNSCTTQTTIENWFALPSFPIIDDNNSAFIGDGGIRVLNSNNIRVGIFLFKPTMLPFDIDPIIVATPDFTPSCPVVFPEIPTPIEDAVWEVVKIGSAVYQTPDPEAEPPVVGGWIITQNYIGSMTLPGGSSGKESPNLPFLPPQLPSIAIQKQKPAPFECRIDINSSGEMLLKIGSGTISCTQSNMPFVKIGAESEKLQYQYEKVQVVPTGWRKEGTSSDDGWMEVGGGYKIQGEGQWYLTACYWDIWEGEALKKLDLPTPVKGRKPFLCLIDAFGNNVDKLFKQTGPGLYTQKMNIQKMEGYNAESTQEYPDWMHCHSTWFNPMKYGYDIKMIARIESKPATAASVEVSVSQTESNDRNMIQNIFFPVLPKDGAVIFSLDDIVADPFYPSPWSGFNDENNLFNALQKIPALKGNITVRRTSEKNFYVTFINGLQKTAVTKLKANIEAFESWPYDYVIDQYITGNVVLDTEPKFNGTMIMNKEGVTQEEDPYTLQFENNPMFNKVVNRQDMLACDNFEGDVSFTGIFPVVDGKTPTAWGKSSVTNDYYFTPNGCQDDPDEDHPFKVYHVSTESGISKYRIVSGTVNNEVPGNIDDEISVSTGPNEVWVKVPYLSTATPPFPALANFEWEIGSPPVPQDTDDECYIRIASVDDKKVTQYVTGSLWAERLKIGDTTARYYWAGV
jgi:hypothetical protein